MSKDHKRPYANYRRDTAFATRAIRAGIQRTGYNEHSPPVFLSSSFWFDDADAMAQIFADEQPGSAYSRYHNPSTEELICKLAALEECEDGVVTASGMGAIFLSLMAFLQSGDHMIATRSLFGSTYKLFTDILPRQGIGATLVDSNNWEDAIQPNSKMLFVETPSNPGLEIIDLKAARQLCDKHGLLLVVDNCFATPYLQQPATWGADLVIHSATKYIDGQGRVLGGAVLGARKLIKPCYRMLRQTGATLSAFNAWLLARSLDTLVVRMERHCQNALNLAIWLQDQPGINKVRHPFLPNHPQYQLAQSQMKLGGGVVTFEIVAGLDAGKQFLNSLALHTLSANLGDTRSIATHPASTTHARLTAAERADLGIVDGTVRISAGLEDIKDIKADITQALQKI